MSSDPDDRLLVAWLARALPRGEARRVEARLASDLTLRAQMQALAAPLHEPAEDGPVWYLPASPRREGLRGVVSSISLMSGRPPRDFRVQVEPVADGNAIVVLLRRRDQHWEVLQPSAPAEVLRARQLPAGTLEIFTDAGVPEHWAVAFAPAGLEIPWELEGHARWAGLRSALASGSASAFCFQLPP